MAKKRLNIKVAIIGLFVLSILMMGVVLVALRLWKDPEKFLAEAETALKQKDYKTAERNYGSAYAYSKDDDFKTDVLFKFAEFHLINSTDVSQEDPSFHEPAWPKALGCWNAVLNIDPKNIEAAMSLLRYFYDSADSGNDGVWETVKSHASDLLEVMEEKELPPDPYVLRAKARSLLRMAALGQTTDREKTINDAINELERLRELTPKDIEIYRYLADAAVVEGQINSSRGMLNATENAAEKAEVILYRAVDIAPNDPKAHINLLNARLRNTRPDDLEAMDALKEEFGLLVDKFDSSAEVHASLASLYMLKLDTLDEATTSVAKAIELDSENIRYRILSGELNYRKSSIFKDREFLDKAIEVTHEALSLPDAQDVPGPRQFLHQANRFGLLSLLSTFYIELALESDEAESPEQKQQWIAKAEETIHEIEQIIGSENNVHVRKWRGLIALAKGNRMEAIREMYDAYEEYKATYDPTRRNNEPQLSYALANVFINSTVIGARIEFLESAIFRIPSIASYKPQAWLDYMEVLSRIYDWKKVLVLADMYDNSYPANERSQRIRINAYIASEMYEEANLVIAEMPPDEPGTVRLRYLLNERILNRAEALKKSPQEESKVKTSIDPSDQSRLITNVYGQLNIEDIKVQQTEVLEKLYKMEPESITLTAAVYRKYLNEGNIARAREIIEEFLAVSPDNIDGKLHSVILNEPDPLNVTAERQKQLTEQVLKEVPYEYDRAIALARFYKINGQLEEATNQLRAAYKLAPDEDTLVISTDIFDLALQGNDMALAEEIIENVRANNIDNCEGNLFAAKLDIIKEDFQEALTRLNSCLESLPLAPYVYFLRSQVNNKLGNEEEAVEDAKTAMRINPLSGRYAKQTAFVLYSRSLGLGTNISSEQEAEVKKALERAIFLNPRDTDLTSIYAKYISKSDPMRSLRVLELTQDKYPTVENILKYAGMALSMSRSETNREQREELLEITGLAFERAYKLEPKNKSVIDGYSEYLRLTDQQEKVNELFSQDTSALWRFYIRDGQYEKARESLEEIYQDDPENTIIINGLIITAVKMKDKEQIDKYSEILMSIENTINNQLSEIQNYIEAGFVEDASLKLENFREKDPENTDAMLLDAWISMMERKADKALVLLNKYLEKNPENAWAWQLRGRANRTVGNIDKALEDMQKSKSLDANPNIRLRLAKLYEHTGKISAAIGELRDAMEDEQAPMEVRVTLESLYLQAGRNRELKDFYSETIKKFPDSVFWRLHEGRFYLYVIKDYNQAVIKLKKTWEMSQEQGVEDMAVLDMFLESLFKSKQYNRLLSFASKYTDTKYAPIVYAQMAQTASKKGRNSFSMGYYRTAIEKSGTNDQLIMGILDNMIEMLGPQVTVNWCNEKLKEDPDSLPANLTMYNIADKAGRFNQALEHIDRFLRAITPENPIWVDYMIKKAGTLSKAYIMTSNKQYLSAAIRVFERILLQKPDDPRILNDLAFLLADNNEQLEMAVEYARRACEQRPNEGGMLDTYAFTLYAMGEYQKAEESYQMAIEIFERNSQNIPWDVYQRLGMTQEKLNKNDQALTSYNNALRAAGEMISPKNKKELNESVQRVLR